MGAAAAFKKIAPVASAAKQVQLCPYGESCYNHDPQHRAQCSHPVVPAGATRHRACRYGIQCKDHDARHLQGFVHPGDRNYRIGLVVFSGGQTPEFETLWQLFSYHDPDESGHLRRFEFDLAVRACLAAADKGLLEAAWCDLGGEANGTVNFARFASWATSHHIDLPIGLNHAGAQRPCRCQLQTNDGERFHCSCSEFRPLESSNGLICECGHKASMHRSDAAECTLSTFVHPDGTPWNEEGLVPISDVNLLRAMQRLLTETHKTTDNWTRDRGCSIHGVGHCPLSCASNNRLVVPKGYRLLKAFRNQNIVLWQRYSLAKSAIADECSKGAVGKLPTVEHSMLSSSALDSPVETSCNEWRLFHGTNFKAGQDICSSNFRPMLAGSGATWKPVGEEKGVPLYGFGIYCSEHITKADEYAKPVFDGNLSLDVCAVVLVRCVGGRPNVVTTNDIDTEQLRKNIFDGQYHSVIGDRVSTLGKPFREVVIYDKDQCYPEFLLVYERKY